MPRQLCTSNENLHKVYRLVKMYMHILRSGTRRNSDLKIDNQVMYLRFVVVHVKLLVHSVVLHSDNLQKIANQRTAYLSSHLEQIPHVINICVVECDLKVLPRPVRHGE